MLNIKKKIKMTLKYFKDFINEIKEGEGKGEGKNDKLSKNKKADLNIGPSTNNDNLSKIKNLDRSFYLTNRQPEPEFNNIQPIELYPYEVEDDVVIDNFL